MKCYKGIMLPDAENHMQHYIDKGPYMEPVINKALEVTPGRKVAVDVGAAVGLFSMAVAPLFEIVVAYEPSPLQAECWRDNIAKTGRNNVFLKDFGLGLYPQVLYVADLKADGNLGKTWLQTEPEGAFTKCSVDRLDNQFYPALDLLKIDVEGMEHDVLLGGQNIIRQFHPTLIIEFKGLGARYGRDDKTTLEMLASWGYSSFYRFGSDYVISKGAANAP